MSTTTTIRDIRKITGRIGAEVIGVDVTQPLAAETVTYLREALAVSDDAHGREVGAYHDRLAVTGRGSAAGAQHLGVGDVVEIDVSKGERKGVVVGAREGEQRLDDALQPQRLGVDDARRFGRFGVGLGEGADRRKGAA